MDFETEEKIDRLCAQPLPTAVLGPVMRDCMGTLQPRTPPNFCCPVVNVFPVGNGESLEVLCMECKTCLTTVPAKSIDAWANRVLRNLESLQRNRRKRNGLQQRN